MFLSGGWLHVSLFKDRETKSTVILKCWLIWGMYMKGGDPYMYVIKNSTFKSPSSKQPTTCLWFHLWILTSLSFSKPSLPQYHHIMYFFNTIVSFFNTTIPFLTSNSLNLLISNKVELFFNPTTYSFMNDIFNSDIIILLGATFTLWYLYYIVKDLIAWFWSMYDGMKEKSETSQSVSLDYLEPPCLKNLGIFDSLITFSQPNINDYNPAH